MTRTKQSEDFPGRIEPVSPNSPLAAPDRSPKPSRKKWLYLLYFLLGILASFGIGYATSYLIHVQPQTIELRIPAADFFTKEVRLVLAVILAGGLGGLLYSLQSGKLELPRIEAAENSCHLGWIGDCLIGVGAAFVIFLIVPGGDNFFKDPQSSPWDIEILATSIIGGYGGRSLLDRALDELLKKQEKIESKLSESANQIEEMKAGVTQVENQGELDAKALAMVDRHLDKNHGLLPAAIADLKTAILDSSAPVKVAVFYRAKRVREDNWKQPEQKVLMARTIPIFEALIDSDSEGRFHRNHGQLAYALKDSPTPNLARAEAELSRAIEIRDRREQKNFQLYEFNRIICRIQQDENFLNNQPSSPQLQKAIQQDLRTVKASDLEERLQEKEIEKVQPIAQWLQLNPISL